MRLGGYRNRYGRDEEEKISFFLPGIELGVLVCPPRCLDTVPPEAHQLLVTVVVLSPDWLLNWNSCYLFFFTLWILV
jgi:hypothetical protein